MKTFVLILSAAMVFSAASVADAQYAASPCPECQSARTLRNAAIVLTAVGGVSALGTGIVGVSIDDSDFGTGIIIGIIGGLTAFLLGIPALVTGFLSLRRQRVCDRSRSARRLMLAVNRAEAMNPAWLFLPELG